jgi:Mannosyltransferase (PIG-V)
MARSVESAPTSKPSIVWAAAPEQGDAGTDGDRSQISWRQTFLRSALIWASFTGLRLVVAFIVEYSFKPDHGRLRDGFYGFLTITSMWDSAYYISISETGYFGSSQPFQWRAFFPGLPLAMRVVAQLATLHPGTYFRLTVAGLAIALLCSLLATVLLYRITELRFGSRAAVCAAVMLMAWPTATFLSSVYSESLYLVLALAAWWFGMRRQWLLAGVFCAGASLTRINGIFVMVALFVMLAVSVAQRRERFRVWKLGAIALGGAGALGYLAYLWANTGDLLAWPHAQEAGWARRTETPWTAFTNTIEAIKVVDSAPRRFQWVADIATVVFGLAASAYFAVKRYLPELTLTVITFAFPMTSGNYVSILRYTLTIFPLFIVGGALLARQREWVSSALLTLSTVWMVGTTVLFTLSIWAG